MLKKPINSLSNLPAESNLFKAREAMERNDWSKAARLWQKVFISMKDKTPPEAYAGLAMANRELDRLQKAETILNQGLNFYPEDVDILTEYLKVARLKNDNAGVSKRLKRLKDAIAQSKVHSKGIDKKKTHQKVSQSRGKNLNAVVQEILEQAQSLYDLNKVQEAQNLIQSFIKSFETKPVPEQKQSGPLPVSSSDERKRVVILGSKPDAKIPQGDVIFCANASIGMYPEIIKKFELVVNVISGYKYHFKGKEEIKASNIIADSNANELIIVRNQPGCIKKLLNQGYDTSKICHVTSKQRRDLTYKITGLQGPFISPLFFNKLTLEEQISAIFISIIAEKRNNTDFDWPPSFKPSTGVFALIDATSRFGASSEYIISGIGINNRNIYSYCEERLESDDNFNNKIGGHLYPDQIILSRMNKIYNISTTEQEIHRDLQVPYLN